MEDIPRLVKQFADNVAAQTEAIYRANSKLGNRHAKKYASAFQLLRSFGDDGRDALASLFTDPRPDARVAAAAFLLRHRTDEALSVLEEESGKPGLISFGAEQAIERWRDGTWALDPVDP